MPPKRAFTLERVQEFGGVAADAARARLLDDGGPHLDHLSCEYRGVAIAEREWDINLTVAGRSTLVYEWHVCVGGYEEKSSVNIRCDKISQEGVPFPKSWHTALRCANLQTIAGEAAEAAREELRAPDRKAFWGWAPVMLPDLRNFGVPRASARQERVGGEIDCKFLGVARKTRLPEPGKHTPGPTVLLAENGSRMAFLLCAQVDGDTWLCHRGSFQDGELSLLIPFLCCLRGRLPLISARFPLPRAMDERWH